MEKIVYQIDSKGYYMYPVKAYEDPLNPGKYLIPRGCVEQQPPDVSPGNIARWNGQWDEVEIPSGPASSIQYATYDEIWKYYTEGVQEA